MQLLHLQSDLNVCLYCLVVVHSLIVTKLSVMENLYSILGVPPSATYTEIKHAFQKMARIYHPDKCHDSSGNFPAVTGNGESVLPNVDRFHSISKAWKVLGDSDLRSAFDAAWQQRCLAQEWPIQDIVALQEFDRTEDAFYSYPCRCGSSYNLSEQDVLFQVDLVCCPSCSLCIQVEYD